MNWQTFVVLAIVVIIFAAIVIKGIKNKKEGKSSCSCGCSSCANKDYCHEKK